MSGEEFVKDQPLEKRKEKDSSFSMRFSEAFLRAVVDWTFQKPKENQSSSGVDHNDHGIFVRRLGLYVKNVIVSKKGFWNFQKCEWFAFWVVICARR